MGKRKQFKELARKAPQPNRAAPDLSQNRPSLIRTLPAKTYESPTVASLIQMNFTSKAMPFSDKKNAPNPPNSQARRTTPRAPIPSSAPKKQPVTVPRS